MDRARAVACSDRAWGCRGSDSDDECVLPSRADAISALASALDARRGPVLLTGEPGVGKTWVCGRLRNVMPGPWRWATVDLSPAIVEGEFLRLVLHALTSDSSGGLAELRGALDSILADADEDGQRWGLIVDEAHNGSAGVLEELRILGNRLGDRGAFAGMILVGQSALTRRLSTRPLAAIQARISARIHLRALDVDELQTWLGRLEPGRNWNRDLIERFHRETGGNPGKILARSSRRPVASLAKAPVTTPLAVSVAKTEPIAVERPTVWDAAPVGPGKPPIRVGDGMIEVGWEPSVDAGQEFEPETEPESTAPVRLAPPVAALPKAAAEEVVDDHYAALQAWTEWAQNQGRQPVGTATVEERVEALPELDPDEDPAARLSVHPGVRVEGHQEFAPYSQLFSRLRQTRE